MNMFRFTKPHSPWWLPASAAISAAAAVALVFWTGRRGFFAFDQSMVFDGAWRLVSGQVPWRDFLFPYGLSAYGIQALFFLVLGVNYSSYLAGAAAVNAGAALAAFAVARLIFPRALLPALLAGLLTAAWFYPPMGTPFVDQTAFFFGLIALLSLFKGGFSSRRPKYFFICAGAAAWLSILAKSTAGSYLLPLYPLVLLAIAPPGKRIRGFLYLASGFLLALILFFAWLALFSRPDNWLVSVFEYPLYQARLRRAGWFGWPHPLWPNFFSILSGGSCCDFFFSCCRQDLFAVFMHHIPPAPRLASLGIFYLVLFRLIRMACLRRLGSIDRRIRAAMVMVVFFFVFQGFYIHHTLNHAANALPFIGLVMAVGAGLLPSGKRGLLSRLPAAGLIAVSVLVFFSGVRVARNRLVHDVLRGARTFRPLQPGSFRPLLWAEPTLVAVEPVSVADMERLYDLLASREGNFFIFPQLQILYGLTGKVSPQPLLWFQTGLTYPGPFDPESQSALDLEIVRALKKNEVDLIVLIGNQAQHLSIFPALKSYLMNDFELTGRIGSFFLFDRIEREPGEGEWQSRMPARHSPKGGGGTKSEGQNR